MIVLYINLFWKNFKKIKKKKKRKALFWKSQYSVFWHGFQWYFTIFQKIFNFYQGSHLITLETYFLAVI